MLEVTGSMALQIDLAAAVALWHWQERIRPHEHLGGWSE